MASKIASDREFRIKGGTTSATRVAVDSVTLTAASVCPDALATYGAPEDTWARLAHRLAARGRVRISRDGGKNYPRKHERYVTDQLPAYPAAVRLFDDDGCAPVFVVDLDAKTPETRAQVQRDLAALTGLLERAGLTSWFSDHSPSGGHHVYVPMAEPIPFAEAREASWLLEQRLTCVDKLPMSNISEGCLRPPGARHKSGGHQQLDCTLAEAEHVLDHPNPTSAWHRFLSELRRHGGPLVPPRTYADSDSSAGEHADVDDVEEQLAGLRGYRAPSESYQAIARTGEYDPARYASPSEARQAVIWAAAAAGWRLADVARRLQDGTWPGLASFYARYAPHACHTALARDWKSASDFEKRRRAAQQATSVRVCTTSPHKSHGGQVQQRPNPPGRAITQRISRRASRESAKSVNQWVREWLTAVDFLHGPGTDLGVRAVLYAMAEAAIVTGSLSIEHGHRHLALGTGLDRSTVTRILARLSEAPPDRALIQLVEHAHGVYAHTYELRIPALHQAKCAEKPWRAGRVHAIRPAFRDLGLAAAFVYAALEQHAHDVEHRPGTPPGIGGRELAARARIGVTATYEALQVLATHGLADRVPPGQGGGWRLGAASLAQLAEAWGILDQVRAQLARHRAERAEWHAWLTEHRLLAHQAGGNVVDLDSRRPPPDWAREPADPLPHHQPYEDTTGLLELLQHELGATLLA